MTDRTDPAMVVEDGHIGLGGRLVIWTLAILLYGGGMALWFVSMPVVRPVVQNLLSILYLFRSNSPHDESTYQPDSALEAYAPAGGEDEEAGEEPPAAPPEPPKKPLWASSGAKWPSVKVVGVMTRQDSQAAMLGKEIVPIGSTHKKLRVLKVEPGRVLLEYEGAQKWVLVGDLTDQEAR